MNTHFDAENTQGYTEQQLQSHNQQFELYLKEKGYFERENQDEYKFYAECYFNKFMC